MRCDAKPEIRMEADAHGKLSFMSAIEWAAR